MGTLAEAVGSPEFMAGLRWGAVTGSAGLLFGLGWRLWRKKPAPIAGLVAVAAATTAMSMTRSLQPMVWVGLGLLGLAGVLFPSSRRVPFLPVLVALPGAWLVGRSELPGIGWVEPLVITTVTLVGPVVASFEEEAGKSPIPIWLFAISAAGAWATVPDTEEVLVLLGALAIPTLLAWPLKMLRLGTFGAYTLPALYMWTIVWGGRGREGSIVGATAALGLLAAPVAAWLAGRERVSTNGLLGFFLVFGHAILVIFVTRVAGFEVWPGPAFLLAVLAFVIALLLWFAVERSVHTASG